MSWCVTTFYLNLSFSVYLCTRPSHNAHYHRQCVLSAAYINGRHACAADGHFRVVVGYDGATDSVLMHDPWDRDGTSSMLLCLCLFQSLRVSQFLCVSQSLCISSVSFKLHVISLSQASLVFLPSKRINSVKSGSTRNPNSPSHSPLIIDLYCCAT